MIFIDLGAYDGDTIQLALNRFGYIRRVYAFEPLAGPFQRLQKRFGDQKGFVLLNACAGLENGTAKIYLGEKYGDIGSSLFAGSSVCSDTYCESVKTIDFPCFFEKILHERVQDEKIILKLNIEGGEYGILDKMMSHSLLKSVSMLYCDWHWSLIGMSEEDHHIFVRRLRLNSHNLCGGKPDEFYNSINIGGIRLKYLRFTTYYLRALKLHIKANHPALFARLKRAKAQFLNRN